MTLHFVAWRGCVCTDVQPTRDFPDRCPCHGGDQLGTSTINEGATVGHKCNAAKGRR